MTAFINGKFVEEREANVSVFDRGFLYGDGLFETIRIHNARPFRFSQHFARLQRGAEFLQLKMQFTESALRGFAAVLIHRNQLKEGVLRIHLSRGIGPRGYSIKGAGQPTLVMTTYALPADAVETPLRWRLATSTIRLVPGSPLAMFKTTNKLPQIIARAEAERAGADEALLVNTNGHAVEAASANLFWISESAVCTAPIQSGVLPGITRAIVVELCAQLGLQCIECAVSPAELLEQRGVFLTLSTLGIVEVVEIDGHTLPKHELTARLWRAYRGLLERETA